MAPEWGVEDSRFARIQSYWVSFEGWAAGPTLVWWRALASEWELGRAWEREWEPGSAQA